MPKNYKHSESKPMIAAEPAVAYQRTKPTAKVVDWNPNYPVHATQEEWWDLDIVHSASSIRRIRAVRNIRL